MSTCVHCSTPFSASAGLEKFCCRGCEFVYELIHHEGLGRFYDLRSNSSIRPVRSLPFEAHDFAWLEEMKEAIEENPAADGTVEADFSLEGLSCVGCVWLVENIFQRQPGAIGSSAHPATGLLRLRWMPGEADLPAFAGELASFGYALTPRKPGARHSEAHQLAAKLGLCGAFAMNAMVFTLPRYVGMPDDFAFAGIFRLVTFLSATLAMLTGGSYFISRAWRSVRARTPHIDLPIALGIIFAFLGSLAGWALGIEGLMYFDFVATFIFLMLAGRYVQLAAVEKNRNRLQRRRPVPEFLRSPDFSDPIPLAELKPGIRFEILPGQSVPVAAVLDSEAADFSLEWINGEADPVSCRAGRTLPGGAIHLGRIPISLTASEAWESSLLARLTSTERTQARVPGLEFLLRIYLVAIVLIGVVGFAAWYFSEGAAPALQVMISVFVVSCPCALGVALPYADELVNSRMERAGVFVREPLLWSKLKSIRTIIFDKTGTLTLERPVLTNPEAVSGLSEEAFAALASLSNGSLHPVSRSLLECLGTKGQHLLRAMPAPEIHDVPGMGRFFGNGSGKWSLGRPGWAAGNPEPDARHDAELCHGGQTVARFRFEETLRPEAVDSLNALRKTGRRLVILSGDRSAKVSATAAQLGIAPSDAHAALQPAEKEAIVRGLDHRDTLYLGDGANDSLAFDAAWVTGTPVVDRSLLEGKSDFYFLGQGLRFLPMMLALARQRRHTVSAAFAFAMLYNAAALTAALLGHMSPLVAAVIMPLSSAVTLALVASGLRDRSGKSSSEVA